jgi:hypothetical protein
VRTGDRRQETGDRRQETGVMVRTHVKFKKKMHFLRVQTVMLSVKPA